MYLLSRMAISVSLEKAGPPPVSEGRRSGGPEEEIGHRHQEAEQGDNCDYPRPEQSHHHVGTCHSVTHQCFVGLPADCPVPWPGGEAIISMLATYTTWYLHRRDETGLCAVCLSPHTQTLIYYYSFLTVANTSCYLTVIRSSFKEGTASTLSVLKMMRGTKLLNGKAEFSHCSWSSLCLNTVFIYLENKYFSSLTSPPRLLHGRWLFMVGAPPSHDINMYQLRPISGSLYFKSNWF